MKPQRTLIFAASAAIAAGLSAFAYAARPTSPAAATQLLPAAATVDVDNATCPPRACTIVFETESGGPPSAQLDVR